MFAELKSSHVNILLIMVFILKQYMRTLYQLIIHCFFDPPVAGHRGVTPCTFSLAVDSFACDWIVSRTHLSSCFQEYFSWWGVTEVVQNVVHMDFQTLPFAELLKELFGLLSLSVEIVWWAAFQQRWLSSKIICNFLSQSLCIVWWCNWNWCL